jgi:hypothetical protein
MKIKLVPLKKFGKKTFTFRLPKGRKLIIFCGLFLLICVVALSVIYKTTRPKTVNCLDIAPQVQEISPPGFNNTSEIRRRYQEAKPLAQICKSKTGNIAGASQAENNLKMLFFYRQMAITAYSYGDPAEGKSYADKALALNDTVQDSARGEKTNASQVKAEMEAIKNDTY